LKYVEVYTSGRKDEDVYNLEERTFDDAKRVMRY